MRVNFRLSPWPMYIGPLSSPIYYSVLGNWDYGKHEATITSGSKEVTAFAIGEPMKMVRKL